LTRYSFFHGSLQCAFRDVGEDDIGAAFCTDPNGASDLGCVWEVDPKNTNVLCACGKALVAASLSLYIYIYIYIGVLMDPVWANPE
jgi:hypothetical protein